MAKSNLEDEVENIAGLALVHIERKFGIVGLDHIIKVLEERRNMLLHEASKERTWPPK